MSLWQHLNKSCPKDGSTDVCHWGYPVVTLHLSTCLFKCPGSRVGCRGKNFDMREHPDLIWSIFYLCPFLFLCRNVWYNLTYLCSASTDQDVKIKGIIDRTEDKITEHLLQTVTAEVKVWETHVNTEYFHGVRQAPTSVGIIILGVVLEISIPYHLWGPRPRGLSSTWEECYTFLVVGYLHLAALIHKIQDGGE